LPEENARFLASLSDSLQKVGEFAG
jgi:hypothetical protein